MKISAFWHHVFFRAHFGTVNEDLENEIWSSYPYTQVVLKKKAS